MSDEEDAELLQVFLDEAREHLGGIEGDLLELETTGAPDPDLVNKVFRIVLCRNLAIYFSPANRIKLFSNLASRLRRGGTLLVSMTENLGPKSAPFIRREHRGVAYYELP